MARLNILIVEDSSADAKLLRLWLSRSPAVAGIEHVRDGGEALRYVRGEAEFAGRAPPDLLLLDSQLPDAGGLELLPELRAASAESAGVLVLSGAFLSADAGRAREQGAIGYISKPSDLDEFAALVRQIEEYADSRERLP